MCVTYRAVQLESPTPAPQRLPPQRGAALLPLLHPQPRVCLNPVSRHSAFALCWHKIVCSVFLFFNLCCIFSYTHFFFPFLFSVNLSLSHTHTCTQSTFPDVSVFLSFRRTRPVWIFYIVVCVNFWLSLPPPFFSCWVCCSANCLGLGRRLGGEPAVPACASSHWDRGTGSPPCWLELMQLCILKVTLEYNIYGYKFVF